MRAGSIFRTPALLLAAIALASIASVAQAQVRGSCTITGPESGCGKTEICGPEGDYTYYWARPYSGIEFTRCILAEEGGVYVLWVAPVSTGIQSEPCFLKFEAGKPTECLITGPDDMCKGSKAELCGPAGEYLYRWSGPGDFSASTQCITASAAGEYTLTVTNLQGTCASVCKHSIAEKTCVINCPRTVGYWGAQCAQKRNGSTKFTKPQVTSIAQCVDGKAAIFNWGGAAFDGFCSAISTTDMNQRVQAKRQFAGLLANVCTGEMGLIAINGDQVRLSTETVVNCGGVSQTIGTLIASMDARLVSLEGQNIALTSVKEAYSAIISCADGINNGRGIGTVCPELAASIPSTSGASAMGSAESAGFTGTLEPGMLRAFPNPFAGTTRLAYAVGPQGERVTLGVYDIAGREVKRLFEGFQSGGVHESAWNATDASGSRVRTGMYFIRGKVGDHVVASRVMLVE